MPRKYKIAVIPGDGIGPEVVNEAVRVLRACEEAVSGLRFDLVTYNCGAHYYAKSGKKGEWEPGAFEACQNVEAVLMGAVGLPGVTYSDGRPVGAKVVQQARRFLMNLRHFSVSVPSHHFNLNHNVPHARVKV